MSLCLWIKFSYLNIVWTFFLSSISQIKDICWWTYSFIVDPLVFSAYSVPAFKLNLSILAILITSMIIAPMFININSSFSNIMMFCLNTFQMSNKILPDFYSVWKYLKRKTVMALQREWSKLLVPDRTNMINYENYESGESHWGCSKWTSWGAMHVAQLIEIFDFYTNLCTKQHIWELILTVYKNINIK